MQLDTIVGILSQLAPESSALPNDPIGLLISDDQSTDVRKVGVCLDATPEAARHAVANGVQLLIAHHPLIYRPLKSINSTDPISRAVTRLIKGNVALYAMHTNWDSAPGGINDTLAEMMELQNVRRLGEHGEQALPRIGDLPCPRPLADFVRLVETTLVCAGTSAIRVNDVDPTHMISRVAVCGGAGAGMASDAQAAGADAYVTSDVRHHEFIEATGRGLALLDAGHGATETPGMRALARLLPGHLPAVEVIWCGPSPHS